jgi:hypothetical protein
MPRPASPLAATLRQPTDAALHPMSLPRLELRTAITPLAAPLGPGESHPAPPARATRSTPTACSRCFVLPRLIWSSAPAPLVRLSHQCRPRHPAVHDPSFARPVLSTGSIRCLFIFYVLVSAFFFHQQPKLMISSTYD